MIGARDPVTVPAAGEDMEGAHVYLASLQLFPFPAFPSESHPFLKFHRHEGGEGGAPDFAVTRLGPWSSTRLATSPASRPEVSSVPRLPATSLISKACHPWARGGSSEVAGIGGV